MFKTFFKKKSLKIALLTTSEGVELHRHIDTWIVDVAIHVERGFMLREVLGTEVLIYTA